MWQGIGSCKLLTETFRKACLSRDCSAKKIRKIYHESSQADPLMSEHRWF
jgi:hypothetical protein